LVFARLVEAAEQRDRAGRTAQERNRASAEAEQGQTEAAERRRAAELRLQMDDEVREQTSALRTELDRKAAEADVWLRLNDLIGDAKGANFRRFAQGLTLDRLLVHANARLADLKPRFTLDRVKGGDMLIQVIDNDMGGEVRGLHNLSGGERFLVSLALALGLAEMSTSGGVKIESLFIDEGFGALDPASLGQAVALLEQLHAPGRRVRTTPMNIESRIKPISYLKAHSADVIRELGEGAPPLVITQNGEAKAVLQDVASYEATQELLALLKLLALGRDDIAEGRVQPLAGLKERVRGRAARA
jgi:prevent-host-death family protein